MTTKAYDRVIWKGKTFNRRTVAALEWVERDTGLELQVAQGSYNKGVGASAGTHDGGGAVDLRSIIYSTANKRKLVHSLRNAGFAAWIRPAVPGLWGEHIHAILIGDKEMASGAAQQVVSYLNGRSGLASNGKDTDPYRPVPQTKFNFKKNKPVVYK